MRYMYYKLEITVVLHVHVYDLLIHSGELETLIKKLLKVLF